MDARAKAGQEEAGASSGATMQHAGDLRRALFRLARRLRMQRDPHGLSPVRMIVLTHLLRDGPSTPGELAATEHHQPQSLTRALADLVRAGLVSKTRSESDRRQHVLAITPAGRAMLEHEMARRDQWLAAAMEGLNETERQVLLLSTGLLERLADHDAPARRKGSVARAIAAAAVSSTLLSGCVLDWDKPGFDVPIAATYRAQKSTEAPRVPDRWAATFGSKELTGLSDMALADNLDIAVAVARITQADAQARVTSSSLYPQLSANGSSSRIQTPGTLTSQTSVTTPTRRSLYNLGLSGSYQVDFWQRYSDASSASRLVAVATRFDRSVVALSSMASLVNTYFQLLAAQDRLRIARDNVRIASDVLDAINKRVQVGTATALDQAQQETVVATQRAAIPPLEQTVEQSRNLIAVLVGRTPEEIVVKGGSLTALRVPRIQPGIPGQILLRRPDVAEAQARLLSQDLSVQSARAAFLPQISLTGTMSVQSIVLKNLLRPEAIAYQIAAQLVQPVFDGYAIQGQYELEKGVYAELLAAYKKSILTALGDVENALVAVARTTEHERLVAQAVAAARRAYDVSIIRLREGTIDIVTLSTTQTQLFNNQDLLAQTRLTKFLAYVQLYQALGGGWNDVKREIETLDEARAAAKDLGPWP